MKLSTKQLGVLRGMGIGAAGALVGIGIGAWVNPFGFAQNLPLAARIGVASQALLIPALCLTLAIGRLARHRFLTPEDIDGSASDAGSQEAVGLQSLLQNTLEQSMLATLVYLAWAVVMPSAWLSVVPIAAVAFGLGRALFFAGYRKGASARATGFAMTFYPTVLMLACVVGYALLGTLAAA